MTYEKLLATQNKAVYLCNPRFLSIRDKMVIDEKSINVVSPENFSLNEIDSDVEIIVCPTCNLSPYEWSIIAKHNSEMQNK